MSLLNIYLPKNEISLLDLLVACNEQNVMLAYSIWQQIASCSTTAVLHTAMHKCYCGCHIIAVSLCYSHVVSSLPQRGHLVCLANICHIPDSWY